MPSSRSKSGSCTCSIAPAGAARMGRDRRTAGQLRNRRRWRCAARRTSTDSGSPMRSATAQTAHTARPRRSTARWSHRSTELPGPYGALRLRIDVENRTKATPRDRDTALRRALVAAHTLVTVDQGRFVSMTEGPEWATPDVKGCTNEGTWPVLAGSEQVVLSSPIILGDNPQIAPESPGDLYDATEIDEILTLRTMTLTDAEKAEARATDPRAARVIEQVDQLPAEHLDRLHGALRYLRRVEGADDAEPDARRRPMPTSSAHASADAVVGSGRRRVGRPGDRSRRRRRACGSRAGHAYGCARDAVAAPTRRTCSSPGAPRPSRQCCSTSTAGSTWA